MRTTLSLVFGAALCATSSFAQLDQACISLSGGWTENSIGGAVQLNDGGFAVVGLYRASNTSTWKALVTKLDANGAVLWRHEYGFGATLNTWAWGAVATSDGGLAVAGDTWSNWGGFLRNAYILKLDTDGDVEWAKGYAHPTCDVKVEANSCGLIRTSDGGFAMIGYQDTNPFSANNYLMLRTDDQGDVLWSDEFHYTGTPAEVAEMEDGDLVFTGWSRGALGPQLTVRKDGLSGADVWRHWYAITDDLFDATAVVAGPDNSTVIAGLRWDTALEPGALPVVFAIDSMGTPLWTTQVAFARQAFPFDMVRHPTGDYLISGRMNETMTTDDSAGFLMRIDASGSLEWAQYMLHQGQPTSRFKRCNLAADGDILLAGELGVQQQFMEKIDPDGMPCPVCPRVLDGIASGDTVVIAPDGPLGMPGSWATANDLTSVTTMSALPATPVGGVCGASSVEENPGIALLGIQPDPCTDRFTISMAPEYADARPDLELLDATGRVVLRRPTNGLPVVVDVAGIGPGHYLIRLMNGPGMMAMGRIQIAQR